MFSGKKTHPVLTIATAILLISGVFAVNEKTAPMAQNQAPPNKTILFDLYGKRGVVFYDHKIHEAFISKDPDYRYKAKPAAACSGCHHTTNAMGVSQLIQCRACHLETGNAKNPKSSQDVEMSTDEAFHQNCIGCHRAAAKGPRLCGGCHKLISPEDAMKRQSSL